MKLGLLLFLFTSTLWADDFPHIFRNEATDSIFLREQNCDLAKEAVEALRQWTESVGESATCDKNFSTVDSACEVEITQCVPEVVRKLQGTNAELSGPNCWNLALVMGQILPGLRLASPEEFNFYMSSALCRPLEKNEERLPGDIIAIRQTQGRNPGMYEIHGMVYVNERLVFSKNGFEKKYPYNLYSADAVAKGYGLRPACFKNQRESKCDIGSDVFRCSSFDSLFEKNLTYNETKVAFDLEKSLERCLNSMPLTEVRTQDITEQIIPVLEVLQRYSEDLEKAAKSKEDRWMQQALKLRLHSMYRSFNEGMKTSNIAKSEKEKLKQLANAIDRSYRSLPKAQ